MTIFLCLVILVVLLVAWRRLGNRIEWVGSEVWNLRHDLLDDDD